jgi:hypothetical protein
MWILILVGLAMEERCWYFFMANHNLCDFCQFSAKIGVFLKGNVEISFLNKTSSSLSKKTQNFRHFLS